MVAMVTIYIHNSYVVQNQGLLQLNIYIFVLFQIEERINIDTLEELKKTFAKADTNKSGQLELDEFKTLLKSKLAVSGNRVSFIDSQIEFQFKNVLICQIC